ncbi:hypothetical protein V8C86DRAFT_3179489 [Haematococcus lacustris]
MRGQANSSNPDDTVYDAVMDGALSFGDLARAGALVDLQPYIRDDPKQVMTIPFIEYPMIMYVNWPLLTSAPYNINWPVLGEAGRLSFYPDTWQELTAVMRQVNATASDPVTGKPRHALCLPVDYDLIFLTHAVMASIMQTAGPTQGWLFDPLTLEPLTNNTAMQQVLQVVWDLAPFLRTFDPAGSIDMTQCAIAISNPALFKSLNPMGANRQFMGQLTMSILPGSTEVLDRSIMQLAYASVVSDALDIRTTAMDARMSGRWSNPNAGIDVEMAMLNPIKSLLGSQQTSVDPADFTTAMSAMTVSLRSLRDSLGSEHFREQLWGTTGFVPPPQPPAPPSPPAPPPSTGSPGLTTPVLVTVIAVPVAVCSLLVLLLAVIITHLRRNAKLQRSLMGHVLPPVAGDKATLVITDVQGSSKLWETMPAGVMEVSMKLHDDLVRRLALDSSGYEWATEGDSFLLCFHSPRAAVAFATQLQDALLRCRQWPVELAAQGSPGQPLCLAPVWPDSRLNNTTASFTSNETLSRLTLSTSGCAHNSTEQLPHPSKPKRQVVTSPGSVEVPYSASQLADVTAELAAQPNEAAPGSKLALSFDVQPKQHMNPMFASEAAEQHESTATLSNILPTKVSNYLVAMSEALARAGASRSLPSSKSVTQQQAPAVQLRGGGERQIGNQGLLGLLAYRSQSHAPKSAPWLEGHDDRKQVKKQLSTSWYEHCL